jgi:hypothetical protein
MRKTTRRSTAKSRRTEFVAARISQRSRHFLDVLSLMQSESLSSVIERGIESLVRVPEEFGGARVVRPLDADGSPDDLYVAQETWAPEDWLRRLKLALVVPHFVPPKERAFWHAVCADRKCWMPADPREISADERARLGPYVLKHGVPVEDAISRAWESFNSTPDQKPTNDGVDLVTAPSNAS